MTQSWASIFPDLDEPVRGRSYSYDRAEASSRSLVRSTRACGREFSRISSSGRIDELGGQAADQLGVLVSDIDGSFDELPSVFGELVEIFDNHGRKLRELENAAADALARARTNWNELETARRNRDSADAAADRINRQLESLRYSAAPDDPLAAYEVGRLESQQWSASNAAASAASALRRAQEDLDGSRTEFHQLRERENDLIDETVRGLKRVDLGELKDPNRLVELGGQVAKGLWDFGSGMVSSAINIVQSLAEGDFLDALWHLSDLIGSVLTVLTVVAVAVAVFATGGMALVLAALVLGAVKLGADAILAGTQHPHPETGQVKTWGEVAVDAVLLAVTAVTAGVGDKIKFLPKRTLGQAVGGVGTSSVTHQRPLITNVKNWVAPSVSASTPPAFVANAQAAMSNAAGKKVLADVVDIPTGEVLNAVGDHVVGEHFDAGPLTTDSNVWTNPVLVDFITDSPMTDEGLATIARDVARLDAFGVGGPSTSAGVPVFQLASAE